MSVFIGYPSFMAYQMMKGKKGNNDGFPSIPGMIARYSALSLTNEQMAENPVWKDLTGNGYDLQMKNFAWSGMSGVDGYEYNFLSSDWVVDKVQLSEALSYKITIVAKKNAVQLFKYIRNESENTIKITLKVTGIEINGCKFRVYDNASASHAQDYKKDGIYQINYTATEGSGRIYFYVYGGNMGQLDNPITIEQLPLYPGALVFDGVDDWAGCDNLPLLPKEKGYSIIALRNWITRYDATQYERPLISNLDTNDEGAFLIEYRKDENVNDVTGSYNSFTDVYIDDNNPITWQTSSSYNGQIIKKGTSKSTNKLCICKTYFGHLSNYANAAIWELVILDHDATEEELTKIKDYFVKTYPWLFPDQAWTVVGKTNEDEDRATIANITGNGNDLVLSNFGFAGGSGYGLYGENYNGGRWVKSTDRADITWTSYSVNITSVKVASTQLYYQSYPEQPSFTVPSYKIKVYGLKDGQTLSYKQVTPEGQQIYKISEDGIYTLPSFLFKANGDWYGFTLDKIQETCDITIEQIPEYEGYLVTDGVDDKAVSKQFKFGKNFTVILDFKFPVKKISYCGFDLSSKVRIQNLQGSGVYVVLKGNKTLIPSNVVRAVTSEGKVYDENWNEYNIVPGNISSNYTMVNLGFDGSNQFAESATKLAGIYSSILSKDECIKAYNHLQTLKSK